MRDFDPTAGEYAGLDWAPRAGKFDGAKSQRVWDFGSILKVAAPIVGGLIGSDATEGAADTQAQSTAESNATQRYFYDTTRGDNMPALQARNTSLQRMQQLLGIGGDNGSGGYGSANGTVSAADVMAQPGYQFGLDQGTTALNRQAAARGSYNSGAALKAASRYGTDYATTKYGDAFNQLQTQQTNQFNRLATTAGMGQTGSNSITAAGANAANTTSANQTALGNALGSAQLSNANGWTNALNQSAAGYASGNSGNALSGSGWTGGANSNGYLPNGDYVGGMS